MLRQVAKRKSLPREAKSSKKQKCIPSTPENYTFDFEGLKPGFYTPSFIPFDIWKCEISNYLDRSDFHNLRLVCRGFMYFVSFFYGLRIKIANLRDIGDYWLSQNLAWPTKVFTLFVEFSLDREFRLWIEACRGLKTLEISQSTSSRYFAVLKNITSLKKFTFKMNEWSCKAFRHFPTSLTNLSFGWIKIWKNLDFISVGSYPPYLTKLEFNSCKNIPPSLFTVLPKTVTHINLQWSTGLTEVHSAALPRNLTYLSLLGTDITNAFLKPLPSTIETLVLSYCHNLQDGCIQLLPVSLTQLSLRCAHVSFWGFTEFKPLNTVEVWIDYTFHYNDYEEVRRYLFREGPLIIFKSW